MITIEELRQIYDSKKKNNDKIQILIEAINDWNSDSEFLEDYLLEIKEYLGTLELTKREVNEIIDKKPLSKDAWKVESISSLLLIVDDENELLHEALYKLISNISVKD